MVLVEKLDPAIHTFKRLGTCSVIYKNSAVCISDVVGYQTFKFLLASSVPQLQSIHRLFKRNIFHQKVNAYGFLYVPILTFLP